MTKQKRSKNIWLLLPLWGIALFIVLYIVATFYYPGGSQADKHSTGFSWTQNYWCNLLMYKAINGQDNPARPIALAGMLVLCLSLSLFWYLFPLYTDLPKALRLSIQVCGITSMVITMFLFTGFHDSVINVASAIGLVAIVGVYIALYKMKWHALFWMGIFNLGLVVVNNILYYGNGLLIYLPVVQKISFASFLIWICLIDIRLYRKQAAINNHPIPGQL